MMPMQPMAFEGGYNPYQGKNRLRQFGFPGMHPFEGNMGQGPYKQPFQPRPFEGGPGALGGPFKGGMPNQPMGGMPRPFEGGYDPQGMFGGGKPFQPGQLQPQPFEGGMQGPMNHLMRFQPLMNYGRSVQRY